MTESESLIESPDWTIWVMRPGDPEPWCWGGNYDDPDGSLTEKRVPGVWVMLPRSP